MTQRKMEITEKRTTQWDAEFLTWYMLLMVNEMQQNLNDNNCTGAASYIYGGDIFMSSPFGFNRIFSRNAFQDSCAILGQTQLSVDFGIGDVAAEEVYGFLVYQFDGVSVNLDGPGRFMPQQMRGIAIAGFTNYYEIDFMVSFYEIGQQTNFTGIRQFLYGSFDMLKRGDCNRWGANFHMNAVFESDYDVSISGRDNITNFCVGFMDTYSRSTIEVEDIYISGTGAMAYFHFMGVNKANGEPIVTNTFAYFDITPNSRIIYLYFINDIYTGTNKTLA